MPAHSPANYSAQAGPRFPPPIPSLLPPSHQPLPQSPSRPLLQPTVADAPPAGTPGFPPCHGPAGGSSPPDPTSTSKDASAHGLLDIDPSAVPTAARASPVYSKASLPQPHAIHRALAEVTDRNRHPDLPTCHLAAPAPPPIPSSPPRPTGPLAGRTPTAPSPHPAFLRPMVQLTSVARPAVPPEPAAVTEDPASGRVGSADDPLPTPPPGRRPTPARPPSLLRRNLASPSIIGSDAPARLVVGSPPARAAGRRARQPDQPPLNPRQMHRPVRRRREPA